MSVHGKVYCVTGASGYIASWLVKLLLHHGHTVHATVRDLNDPKKTQHLYALEGAKERLYLFKADLLEDGSFDSAVHGCEGVFHTASPATFAVEDPQAELIDPAVKGTLNVLGSCLKTSSVRRVVVTSSMATVAYNKRARGPDVMVDETWFSEPEYIKGIGVRRYKGVGSFGRKLAMRQRTSMMPHHNVYRLFSHKSTIVGEFRGTDIILLWWSWWILLKPLLKKMWYGVSKIMAEEAAWKFAKENNLDMVVIHPSAVCGPLLQPTLNSSSSLILSIINGSPTFINKSFGFVDVRDVAKAHILAMEITSASGRYCLAERVLHCSEIVKILKKLYPEYQYPEKCADEEPFDPTYQVSKEKVQCLGLTYTPMEVCLKDMIESFKERKFIK